MQLVLFVVGPQLGERHLKPNQHTIMNTPTLLQQRAIVASLEADHFHAMRELDRKLSIETSRLEQWLRDAIKVQILECYHNEAGISAKLDHERSVYADMQLQAMKQPIAKAPVEVQQWADDEIDFAY